MTNEHGTKEAARTAPPMDAQDPPSGVDPTVIDLLANRTPEERLEILTDWVADLMELRRGLQV